MTSGKIQCDICHDLYLLDEFRFLACGHGFCIRCVELTRTGTDGNHRPLPKKCAICREPWGKLEPRQIYINFTHPTVAERADRVIDGLDRIDGDSPSISLKRAGKKFKDVAKEVKADPAIVQTLLDAAENLSSRIYPVFSELEEEKKRTDVLQAQVAELTQTVKRAEPLNEKIVRLRAQLKEAEENYNEAVTLTETATRRLLRERAKASKLDETTKEQDGELLQLRETLTRYQNENRLLKVKLRVLAKQQKHPTVQAQDPDASLQVEAPMMTGAGPSKPATEPKTSSSHRPSLLDLRNHLADDLKYKRRRLDLAD